MSVGNSWFDLLQLGKKNNCHRHFHTRNMAVDIEQTFRDKYNLLMARFLEADKVGCSGRELTRTNPPRINSSQVRD